MFLTIIAVAAATAMPSASSPVSTPSAPLRPASVAIVWHLPPAPYPDKSVRQAAIAIAAADALASPLHALRDHPLAHFSLAVDADALDDLALAAAGGGLLQTMAQGKLAPGDARTADVMRVLAQVPPLDPRLAATPAARRYQALAAAAPLALAGQRAAHFSVADDVDFAGFAALVRVAAAGGIASHASLLAKPSLTSAEASSAVSLLAKLDAGLFETLKAESASGQLELLADPAREPILPLLVDGGGSIGPNVVPVGAAADAANLVNAALRAASASAEIAGVYSPHGAYDDRTAQLMAQAHAAFALFSDRVLRASPIGGSREAVFGADVAAYRAYALKTSSGTLPVLFWDEDNSLTLSVLSPRLPASAMGGRVRDLARRAGANAGVPSIIVLRVEADGLWNRRADREKVVEQLAADLSTGDVTPTTMSAYLASTPPSSTAYGFSAGSDAGALTYWMGDQNQRSMWVALADARKAAGSDDALAHTATRTPLLEAEASHWFLAPTLAAPASQIERLITQFRGIVADIYRGAGKPVPSSIAPVKLEVPTPAPNPIRQP